MMRNQDANGSFCCDTYVDWMNDCSIVQHDTECDNYDGAPVEQWEVTTPDDVYYTDEYYSGTGEMIGDDSYIDYLNRY